MNSDTPASHPNHPSNHYAALQPGSGPTFADSTAAKPDGSGFRSVQSHPDSRTPVSEHAAAYLNQWNASRAALSTNTNDTAVSVPAPMPKSPRSALPAVVVRDSTAGGQERAEILEASVKAPKTPVFTPGGSNGVDTVMDSPEDVKFRKSEVRPTEDKSVTVVRNQAVENHTGSEQKKGNVAIKQEHKAASDRERNIKAEHSDPFHGEDDDTDIELILWKKINDKKTAEDHRGASTSTKTKDPKLDRVIKKGVAYVKKPAPKVRKGKLVPRHVG